jgi:hypothetical protein
LNISSYAVGEGLQWIPNIKKHQNRLPKFLFTTNPLWFHVARRHPNSSSVVASFVDELNFSTKITMLTYQTCLGVLPLAWSSQPAVVNCTPPDKAGSSITKPPTGWEQPPAAPDWAGLHNSTLLFRRTLILDSSKFFNQETLMFGLSMFRRNEVLCT